MRAVAFWGKGGKAVPSWVSALGCSSACGHSARGALLCKVTGQLFIRGHKLCLKLQQKQQQQPLGPSKSTSPAAVQGRSCRYPRPLASRSLEFGVVIPRDKPRVNAADETAPGRDAACCKADLLWLDVAQSSPRVRAAQASWCHATCPSARLQSRDLGHRYPLSFLFTQLPRTESVL